MREADRLKKDGREHTSWMAGETKVYSRAAERR